MMVDMVKTSASSDNKSPTHAVNKKLHAISEKTTHLSSPAFHVLAQKWTLSVTSILFAMEVQDVLILLMRMNGYSRTQLIKLRCVLITAFTSSHRAIEKSLETFVRAGSI